MNLEKSQDLGPGRFRTKKKGRRINRRLKKKVEVRNFKNNHHRHLVTTYFGPGTAPNAF